MSLSKPVELLLVEDNPRDAELTLRALRTHGLADRIEWMQDGAAALEYIFHPANVGRTPRVVFLDLKLPRVDGLEVLRRIRADGRTAFLPVVVLSSSHEERDLVACYRLHANSYVVKPVDFERFCEVVGKLGLFWMFVNEPPPATTHANGESA